MGVLTVSIKEELTLNGTQQGGINTLSIGSVTQSFKRVVTLPANGGSGNTQTTVAIFRDLVTTAVGAIDDGDAKYARVTNLDSSNNVTLSLQLAADGTSDASTTNSILLKPGHSFILGATDNSIAVDDDGITPITSGNLVHLHSIIAINEDNADIQLEVFIAS